ncbi:MAG: excinuclease ABC subunit UvrC [Bacilli bacterium]|nr:excinuclease ABC subunit UvrC [Bacilli bacterium]
MKDFKEKLSLVPNKPGSYQMKNKDGIIIYVGKAKNLQRRLRSYFTRTVTGKTKMLVDDIDDFEYIVTSSELESLILEITLIKKYDPKYNILLRDDKSYPYIELTNDKYPTLKVVRNVKRKKNKNHLYGPYPNVNAARKTVNIVNRVYPLRKCDKLKKELCLYYHIHECLGYCEKEIPEETINKMKKEIISFLKGDPTIISKKIEQEMDKASKNMNYEKALELKKMLDDIKITLKKQKIDLNKSYNFDLVNYYYDNNYLGIEIFFIRDGLLFGRHNEIIASLGDIENEVVEYLVKFYAKGLMPTELVIPKELDKNLLEEYFQIKVFIPQRGKIKSLLKLARENAKEQLDLRGETLKRDNDERLKAIEELRNLLGLESLHRMESFDNSHLFGTFYVGGMVVFDDFLPNKDLYRKYKISTEVKDDLSAMKEVIYRRYFKTIMEESYKPDLIVMDGGKLQISVCKEVLDSLNLKIPIIGLVKDKAHKTNHIMTENYELLEVEKDSKLFLFLTRIQEEVHRYAITYHRNIKAKGALSSLLDLAPGIGEVRKKELLKKFGSLKRIKEASIEELEEVLNKDVAEKLHEYLKEI